jgi:hypothetical protein
MNPNPQAISVTKCLTEDLCYCLGAEKLDQYSNGSITSPLEIHVIESHLLVCQSCQFCVEAADYFICTLREAEPSLQCSASPSISGQRMIWTEAHRLATCVALFSFIGTLLVALATQTLPGTKRLSLISTRAASLDFQKPAQPLSLAIDSPDSITHLPFSMRLLSSDGFVLKVTPEKQSAVLSLPRGLPPGQYWIQLIVSGSNDPIREYSLLVRSQSLKALVADLINGNGLSFPLHPRKPTPFRR